MIDYSVFPPSEAESQTHKHTHTHTHTLTETQLKKTYPSKLEVKELSSQVGSKRLVIPTVEDKAHHLTMNSGSIHHHKADATTTNII